MSEKEKTHTSITKEDEGTPRVGRVGEADWEHLKFPRMCYQI